MIASTKNAVLYSVHAALIVFLMSSALLSAQTKQLKTFSLAGQTVNIPAHIPDTLLNKITQNETMFVKELEKLIRSTEPDLLLLVDKNHPLDAHYIPHDITPLAKNRAYLRNRNDLSLRHTAEAALQVMALAAKKNGVTIVVSSSYRSYAYQKNLFARYVKQYGKAEAETFSARAGTSQHQLGTVVDFGSITDAFAATAAGKWVKQHAGEYGWSLSFPRGYDKITGYVWESWHYRYIGKEACAFQKKWFGDIQQYMLEFLAAWKNNQH